MNAARLTGTVSMGLALAALALSAGCVERTITVVTQPGGATLDLDTDNVGLTTSDVETTCSVPFDFHGTRTLTIRKPGYETLVVKETFAPPPYEWPVIGFVCEILLPVTIHERHFRDYRLTPREPADPNQIIKRADALADRVKRMGEK